MSIRSAVATAALAVGAWTGTARAGGETVVLDACIEPCSAEDTAAFDAVRAHLEGTEVISRPAAVMERLADAAPYPGIVDPTVTGPKLVEALQRATKLWRDQNKKTLPKAREDLESALAQLDDNPALFLLEPALRDTGPRALLAEALLLEAWSPPAHAGAVERMAQFVRRSPVPSLLDKYGPVADELFQAVKGQMLSAGKGTLVVSVDQPDVVVYLDASGEPHAASSTTEVFAGETRVFVQDTKGSSRWFRATVGAGLQTTLHVAWKNAVHFDYSARRAGFTYESAREREQLESGLVHELAGKSGLDRVVVVSRDPRDAAARVRIYDQHGEPLDELRAADPQALARAVAHLDRPLPGEVIRVRAAAVVDAAPVPARSPSSDVPVGRLVIATLGLGGGALAASVTGAMLYEGGYPAGWYVLTGTAVAVGFASLAYLVHYDRRMHRPTVALLPAAHGAVLGLGGEF